MATTHVRQSWNHFISSPNSFSCHTSDSCVSKSFIQSAKGTIFHFQSVVFSRLERTAVKVTLDCVLLLHSHRARVAVMTNACYWRVHVCVACVQSQRRPAHTCVWRYSEYTICVARAKTVMNTLFHGCLGCWVRGGSRESRPRCLRKTSSCWFVLVEQIDGEREGWYERAVRTFSMSARTEEDCWKCINAGVPIKPGKVSLWNTIPLILFCWLDGRLEEVKILSFLVQFCPS